MLTALGAHQDERGGLVLDAKAAPITILGDESFASPTVETEHQYRTQQKKGHRQARDFAR